MVPTRTAPTSQDGSTRQPCWCQRSGPDNRPVGIPAMHCLVVDHHPAHLNRLAQLLAVRACVGRVTRVTDPVDVLRVIGRAHIDVAFVEARLPGRAGPELGWLFKRLRTAPAVVLITDGPDPMTKPAASTPYTICPSRSDPTT